MITSQVSKQRVNFPISQFLQPSEHRDFSTDAAIEIYLGNVELMTGSLFEDRAVRFISLPVDDCDQASVGSI